MTFPLTSSQQQLWFIDEFHHGLPAHNVPHQLTLTGQLDLAAFRRAIDGLVARHAALRTRLPAGPAGTGVQVVDSPGPVKLGFTELTGMPGDAASAELARIAAAESARPFQLAADWPIRASLVRLGAGEHVLVLVVHQLAFDEASAAILVTDLAALYQAEVTGRPAPAGPPVTFADYAIAEPGRISGEHERYWADSLAGVPSSRFPADRPRPVLASHDGAVELATIGPQVLAGLRQLARREGTTLHATLLAALQVMLYRYTGQADVVVGTAVPNRGEGPGEARLPPLIGFVEATLPVRADLSGEPSFTELLGRVHVALAGAVAHQDLPFARIVDVLGLERDPGRFPVFQTWLRCREPVGAVTAAGVTFRIDPADPPGSRYDLGLDARPARPAWRSRRPTRQRCSTRAPCGACSATSGCCSAASSPTRPRRCPGSPCSPARNCTARSPSGTTRPGSSRSSPSSRPSSARSGAARTRSRRNSGVLGGSVTPSSMRGPSGSPVSCTTSASARGAGRRVHAHLDHQARRLARHLEGRGRLRAARPGPARRTARVHDRRHEDEGDRHRRGQRTQPPGLRSGRPDS